MLMAKHWLHEREIKAGKTRFFFFVITELLHKPPAHCFPPQHSKGHRNSLLCKNCLLLPFALFAVFVVRSWIRHH